MLGAVSVATACVAPGSVAARSRGRPPASGSRRLDIEHPTGFFTVELERRGRRRRVPRAALGAAAHGAQADERRSVRARPRVGAARDHRLPRSLHDGARRRTRRFREQQLAGFEDPRCRCRGRPQISDDEIRETIEGNQLKLQRERGADLTIFSPRASAMAHHEGDEPVSQRLGARLQRPHQARRRPVPGQLRRRLPAAAVARACRSRNSVARARALRTRARSSSAATSTPTRAAATGPRRR